MSWFEPTTCDAIIEPKSSFIRRTRKDGTLYSVPIIRGDKCGKPTTVTIKGHFRCPTHRKA